MSWSSDSRRLESMHPSRWSAVLVAALVAAGCRGLEPETEVGRAAASGAPAALASLLEHGADPNLFDRQGIAPLHIAARHGRVEAIRALVEAGADVDLFDRRNGWTPLLHAIHKRRTAAAIALLEAGADPNRRRGTGGAVPLVMAAGYGSTEVVRALLEHGADPYVDSAPGLSVLWAAAGGGAIADITDGPPLGTCFPDTVLALLERAPDLKLDEGALLTRVVRALGRSKNCREAFAQLERGGRLARTTSGR